MQRISRGFALPTVLIGGLSALIIATSAVQLTMSSVRSAVDNSWDKKAKLARDAGIAYVEECIKNTSNTNDPLVPWINSNKPITQSTNCIGNTISGGPQYVLNTVATANSPRWYATFTASVPASLSSLADSKAVNIEGKVSIVSSSGSVVRSYTSSLKLVFNVQNPNEVDRGSTSSVALIANGGVICVYSTAKQMYCAGSNFWGQQSNGTSLNQIMIPGKFQLPTGEYVKEYDNTSSYNKMYTLCVIAISQNVYCAGNGNDGNLGNGSTASSTSAVKFQLPNGVYGQKVASTGSTCVLTTTQELYCAGRNDSGALGVGTTVNFSTPAKFQLPAGVYVQDFSLGEGGSNLCALTSTAEVYCAGGNSNGILGDGTTINRSTPVKFQLPAGKLATEVRIRDASSHICVLTDSQEVYCSGWNGQGRLGDGTTINRSTPVKFQLPAGLYAATLGPVAGSTNCVLTTSQEVYCAGQNAYGTIGDGTTTNRSTPVKFQLPAGKLASKFSINLAGIDENVLCVLTTSQEVYCAGINSRGQLGDGTTTNRSTPVKFQLPAGLIATDVHVDVGGGTIVCASTSTQELYCAGSNSYGQLGDGTTTNRSTPVKFQL